MESSGEWTKKKDNFLENNKIEKSVPPLRRLLDGKERKDRMNE